MGRMGAMILAARRTSEFSSTKTLWRGKPHRLCSPGALEALQKIRHLIFEGNAGEAGKLAKEKAISDPVRQLPYQPFGDLRLTFRATSVTEYRRERFGFRHRDRELQGGW